MTYTSKIDEVKNYIILEILSGKIKNGEKLKDKRFFTSKFKINPTYFYEVVDLLEKENIIEKRTDGNYFIFDNKLVGLLRNQYLNNYINEFIKDIEKIGLTLDDAIDIIKLRSLANG